MSSPAQDEFVLCSQQSQAESATDLALVAQLMLTVHVFLNDHSTLTSSRAKNKHDIRFTKALLL